MHRVGIAGATGYLGAETLDLLLRHPAFEPGPLASTSKAGQAIASVLPRLRGRTSLGLVPLAPESFDGCDAVVLACPQGVASDLAPSLDGRGVKVVDLSGDHRLTGDAAVRAYGREAPLAKEAAYGLPEKAREPIRRARIVANPGCYATAAALALLPLGRRLRGAIVDGKSGVTGAGREPSTELHFPEMNEAMRAYKVGAHRHEPEIARTVGAPITFTPHIVPLNRGLLVTAYPTLDAPLPQEDLDALYAKTYGDEPFVRLGTEPDVKDVAWTNVCDVKPHATASGQVVVTAALDNLRKGGAAQAVQNLNVLFGLPETTGLGDAR